MKEQYKILNTPQEVFERAQIDKSIYFYDNFECNPQLSKKGIRNYENYKFCFLTQRFFQNETSFNDFMKFLKDIGEKQFIISAPLFNLLYPVEISTEIGFDNFINLIHTGCKPLLIHNENRDYYTIDESFIYVDSKEWVAIRNQYHELIIIAIQPQLFETFAKSCEGLMDTLGAIEYLKKRHCFENNEQLDVFGKNFTKKMLKFYPNKAGRDL